MYCFKCYTLRNVCFVSAKPIFKHTLFLFQVLSDYSAKNKHDISFYELVNILVQKSFSKVRRKVIRHTKYLPYTTGLNNGLLYTRIAECVLFIPFVAYVLH